MEPTKHDLLFARAPVRVRALDAASLARVQEIAVDPEVLEEAPPFVWTAAISNNRLDFYYTRMRRDTLENFAADAQAGVSFLDSHNSRRLGIGRSLGAEMRETPGGNPDFEDDLLEVLASFYTLPGHNPGGGSITADDFIRGVRGGLIFDVSVGFYGSLRCALCGQQYWSWDCPHILGLEYDVVDDEGNVTGTELAWAWVEDGHLAEVSAVYDGATPGAIIEKAAREIEEGRMSPKAVTAIETRYRVRLPAPKTVSGWSETRGGVLVARNRRDADAEVTEPVEAPEVEAEEGLSDGEATETEEVIEVSPEADALAGIEEALAEADLPEEAGEDARSRIKWLLGEHARLAPLAEVGAAYRRELEDEAWKARVRAGRARDDEQVYRRKLGHYSVEELKLEIEDWEALGADRFKPGRQTRDDDERGAAPAESDDRREHAPSHVFGG